MINIETWRKSHEFLVKSPVWAPGPQELLAGDAARRCGSRTCAGAMATFGLQGTFLWFDVSINLEYDMWASVRMDIVDSWIILIARTIGNSVGFRYTYTMFQKKKQMIYCNTKWVGVCIFSKWSNSADGGKVY